MFPQSTQNAKKQNVNTTISPLNNSLSPRKRLFSSKHRQKPQQNYSLNSSNQLNTSITRGQRRDNLTIKTGTSIEALKDLMTPSNQPYSQQLKQLLTVNTSTKGRQPVLANVFVENTRPMRRDSKKPNRSTSKDKDQMSQIQASHKKNLSYQLEKTKDLGLIKEQDMQQTVEWKHQKIPLTPSQTIQQFTNLLSDYEKTEIQQYRRIYYIGQNVNKQQNIKQQVSQYNDGFDNSKGEYNYQKHDHIGYRYEIIDELGKGSFGQVIKVYDHKKKVNCALKIIRNKKKFQNQALVELNLLTFIKEKDEENLTNIVKIQDFVIFRNHVCIVFELLSMNLYELIKNNNYHGLTLELIRRFAIQILNALNFLYKYRIVHCDLKPENILLKQPNKSGLKIVDFGSSCFEKERIYTYIQSRYYRAPEVILGLPYEMAIDMWSFGCIMAELYMGYPIFPGENEQEQMTYIMELIGQPPKEIIESSPRRKYFFSASGQALSYTNSRGKTRVPNSKDLKSLLKCSDNAFIDFLSKCFVWEKEKRMKPLEALMHNWILEGLPQEIRVQHIKYLESEQQTQKQFFKQGNQGQQDEQKKDMTLQNLLKNNKELTPQNRRILNNSLHQKSYFPQSTKNQY